MVYVAQKNPGLRIRLLRVGYKFAYAIMNLLTRYVIKNTFGAQVAVWHRKKLLLVKTSYRPGFGLPGGYLNRNEQPKEGALRELFEETGLAPGLDQLSFVCRVESKCHSNTSTDSIYSVHLSDDENTQIQIDGAEIVEASFFSSDELKEIELDGHVTKYLQTFDK